MKLSRRACLGAILFAPVRAARAAAPRVVALDWGWAATAIGLGLVPAGVAETSLYRDWVVAPALPEGAVEVGLRAAPSLDILSQLRPDLILTNAFQTGLEPRLRTIAPTLANPTFAESRTPLANAKVAARLLGERVLRPVEAAALVSDAEAGIAGARARLGSWQGRALLPLLVIDRRHLTIYGDGSLFVDVLRALGLESVWPGATNIWGSKTISVADLAGLPPGDLLALDPMPAAAMEIFDPAGLLARLCAAERRVVHRLPATWGFGDLTAAVRFADLLASMLERKTPT